MIDLHSICKSDTHMKKIYACLFIMCSTFSGFAQTLSVPFTESFSSGLNGWQVPTPGGAHDFKWYADQGENNLGGLRMKLPAATNYVASPPIYLQAGKTYTAFFKTKVASASSTRRMKVGFNTARQLTGSTFFFDEDLPNNGYTQLPFIEHNPTFSVPSTGSYYLLYFIDDVLANTGYLFTFVDEIGVEETILPSIVLNTPINNFTKNEDYADSTRIYFDASAADADGTVKVVDFFVGNLKIASDSFAPYQFTWKDPKPGVYKVYAKAKDNKNNEASSDTSSIQINFNDGLLKPYVQWDFNTDNTFGAGLDYWQFYPRSGSNTEYRPNNFFRGSQALENNSVSGGDNFAASPSFFAKAGEVYNLSFLARSYGVNRTYRFLVSKNPSLVDTVLIDTALVKFVNAPAEYDYERNKTFSVATDGVYHIIIFTAATGATPNIKVRFDQIRVRGNFLKAGPVAKMISPDRALTYAVNASMTLQADVKSVDDAIAKVEYYANNVKVAESSTAPFAAVWQNAPLGVQEIMAKSFTVNNVYGISSKLILTGVANQFSASSFMGSLDNDEVRGAVIKENNEIVLAGNFGILNFPSAQKYYLNGATDASPGTLITLSSDGKQIISITRLTNKIADLAKDRNDNLYIAAVADGIFKVNAKTNNLLWQKSFTNGKYVQRLDAGSTGHVAVMLTTESNIDDGTLTGGVFYHLDKDGNLIANLNGVGQYAADVCIDETTETIVLVGFKNFNTLDQPGGSVQPVYVPIMRGLNFDGSQRWVAYDWSNDEPSPRWLNKPANNMADLRFNRCSIGKDGKLYVVGQVYGGNHCMRYDAFDIMLPGKMATGGDTYFNLANTGTETHVIFGRYEPLSGAVLKTQSFTARLANTKGNSVFAELGNIAADELSNVYVTGTSAFGAPQSVDYVPGDYTGGGYLLVTNADMNSRLKSVRLSTSAYGKALAVKNSNQSIYGGNVNSNAMYITSPAVQANSAGAVDGFYAVINTDNCTLPNQPINLVTSNTTKKNLVATHLFVDANCKLLAKVLPQGANAISDTSAVKVWIEATATNSFVKRHFEIAPLDDNGMLLADANTKMGRITLYFTQQEFNEYNSLSAVKLPTNANDATGIANLLIKKYAGVSADGSGLPSSYSGSPININPIDNDVFFNNAADRWEVSFDVTGFSGFFAFTQTGTLPLRKLQFTGKQNSPNIQLDWEVQDEKDIKEYALEMSTDGYRFANINTQTARLGAIYNRYQFVDASHWTTTQKFYRLKIVEKNGSFTYSNILKFKQVNDNAAFSVAPNPVVHNCQISGLNGEGLLRLMHSNGLLLQQLTVNASTAVVQMKELPAGTYILQYISKKGITQQKIVKQ